MMAKDIADIAKAAQEQGWTVDTTASNHPRFTPSDKDKHAVTFSGTPGDQHAIDNFIGAMRGQGFVWPWPPQTKSNKTRKDRKRAAVEHQKRMREAQERKERGE